MSMAEKPILFSTEMVKAILDGRKTMTRRVVKNKVFQQWVDVGFTDEFIKSPENNWNNACPYQPGDRLYVKENTWIWCEKKQDGLTPTGKPKYRYIPVGYHVVYQADHPTRPETCVDDNPEHGWRLKVARYMPKWAARIFLTVTDVRVERLQNITPQDCESEGAIEINNPLIREDAETYSAISIQSFKILWDSLNASRGFSWEQNPWVWVISFERIEL